MGSADWFLACVAFFRGFSLIFLRAESATFPLWLHSWLVPFRHLLSTGMCPKLFKATNCSECSPEAIARILNHGCSKLSPNSFRKRRLRWDFPYLRRRVIQRVRITAVCVFISTEFRSRRVVRSRRNLSSRNVHILCPPSHKSLSQCHIPRSVIFLESNSIGSIVHFQNNGFPPPSVSTVVFPISFHWIAHARITKGILYVKAQKSVKELTGCGDRNKR